MPTPSRPAQIPPSQDLIAAFGVDLVDLAPLEVDLAAFEVDLREYIRGLQESENEAHVSSLQSSQDECQTPLPPPSSSNSQPNVDEGDLPTWMVNKGRWKYITSTAGGPTWEKLLKVYITQERHLEFMEKGSILTHRDRPLKIKEYFKYAHQPSRGDTVTLPGFGAEMAGWWERIQPKWRIAGLDPPQGASTWSYILSGGPKGVFLIIMCLAWWSRAHMRYREVNGAADGVDVPDHDPEWLKVVSDVTFVMEKAQECNIPTRGVPSSSRTTKRKHETEPATPRKKSTVSAARPKDRTGQRFDFPSTFYSES